MYDNEDSVCGIIYNNVPYYFRKNLQGDIIAIVDKDAKEVARYSYDAWGACTVVSGSNIIAYRNPFRYRGYYYDIENKLYYLNSRYYDPAVGRFINTDELTVTCIADELNNINSYTYCKNNPISYKDPYGNIAIVDDIFVVGVALLAVVSPALLMYISTPQFKSAWYDFCSGLLGLLSRLWGWIQGLFLSAIQLINNAVLKCVEKATDIIRRKRGREYYWIASSVTFKKGNKSIETFFPCKPISFYDAKNYVKAGGNVFASSESSARKLAYAVGNGAYPIGPEKHGGLGYFYHYHAHRHIGGHIFFIFWG